MDLITAKLGAKMALDKLVVKAKQGGDTLTWDGNTEGLVSVDGYQVYKISDAVPMPYDLVNGATVVYKGENLFCIEEDITLLENGVLIGAPYVWIAFEDGAVMEDRVFPEKGVYFTLFAEIDNEGNVAHESVSSLTIPGYTGFPAEKIDPVYLPDSPIVYVGLNDDEMSLDRTAAEIAQLVDAGKAPFCPDLQGQLALSTDNEGNPTITALGYPICTGISEQVAEMTCQHFIFNAEGVLTSMNMYVWSAEVYIFPSESSETAE